MITILTARLRAAVADVEPAVAKKSTMPILQSTRLRAFGDALVLEATNLEIGIRAEFTPAPADLPEALLAYGVCLPFTTLKDIVFALPDDETEIVIAGTKATIRSGAAVFSLPVVDGEEFPTLPEAIGDRVAVSREALLAAWEAVVFAAASDDSRPVLAGVRCAPGSVAAADGFRLAVAQTPEMGLPACVIPARSIVAMCRALANDDGETVQIALTPGKQQIVLVTTWVTIVSRLIDGTYPDVERVIPANTSAYTAVLPVAALRKAVKAVAFAAKASQNVVKIAASRDMLIVSANAPEVGEGRIEVPLDAPGADDEALIALNVQFVAEALDRCTGETRLILGSPTTPAMITTQGGTVRIVIMPMALR